jgi:phosphoribosylaminoimidazole-succinocarboxamide synthase
MNSASQEPLLQTDLPYPLHRRGKVRDVYDLGEHLLLVATDRISAFDCIMPNGIPGKGRLLTQMSLFWFRTLPEARPNHLVAEWLEVCEQHGMGREEAVAHGLEGRALLVEKVEALPIECVVRGYITGSLWQEYQAAKQEAAMGAEIHGIRLPLGLRESERLPEPIFTPATKAESGHDINISGADAAEILGQDVYDRVRAGSIALYESAAEHARGRGMILADTKFEFGRRADGEIILIDEVLTPDSSRFWDAAEYEPGRGQHAFDKQFVRDYLLTLTWDRTPPAPALPPDVVQKTAERYREAYARLAG